MVTKLSATSTKVTPLQLTVVGQFERHISPAAKAAIDFASYGTAEAVPIQSKFKSKQIQTDPLPN
jgi:hypothetical protein